MSDEMNNDEIVVIEALNASAGVDVVGETMGKFIEAAGVDKVYGRPVKQGDVTIIPAAEVVTGLGFGAGFGDGTGPADEEGNPIGQGGGGGGGGGGRSVSRPVAVVISSPEGVRVEPVVDVTKVALAALTAAGFMFTTLMRMMRGDISDEE